MPGKLIICQGLPGSGKSTWARKYVQDEVARGNRKIVNIDRDGLRIINGFPVTPGIYEPTVSFIRDSIIANALRKDYIVIESSTNLRTGLAKDLVTLAKDHGASLEVKEFNTSVEECIARDLARSKTGGHFVGEEVIRNMFNKYIKNGWPKIDIEQPNVVELYIADTSLPRAVIVDIDGTVADAVNRSPYDYSKVFTDAPKWSVIDVVNEAYNAGNKIIFMSGRPESCRNNTELWLQQYIGTYHELFMRTTGDHRPDYVIKLELFNKHIRNDYWVQRCIDDRKQVIDMYRSLGITVFDVAGHIF